jgi:hypothetical protein
LSKVHNFWLPVSFWSAEGCFPHVLFLNAYVIVFRSNVKFGEKGVSLKFFCDVFNVREWILIFYCPIVDWSLILYWAI